MTANTPSSNVCNGDTFAASAAAYAAPPVLNAVMNWSWKIAVCALSAWYSWPNVPNNAAIAAETSSPPAASTCVVGIIAAAFADLIVAATPARSCDAAANASGPTIRYDDIFCSTSCRAMAPPRRQPPESRLSCGQDQCRSGAYY